MEERTERIVMSGVALTVAGIFLLSKFDSLSPWKETLSQATLLLGAIALLAISTLFIVREMRKRYTGGRLQWSVEGQGGDVLVLNRDGVLTLLKAFEVLFSPRHQDVESWASSRVVHQNPLEGITRVGVEATIVTVVKHTDPEASPDLSQPLIRTFVVTSHDCDQVSSQANLELDSQTRALQSAVVASTRGYKVVTLRNDELISLAKRLFFERVAEKPSGEASCSTEDVNPLHFVDARVNDIVEGSTFPTTRSRGGLKVGQVVFAGSLGETFDVSLSSISRHMVMFGATGSGKSNTGKQLVRLLALKGIPVLIFDFHNEYSDVVGSLGGEVIKLDGSKRLDVLHPFPIADFSDHVSVVTDAFNNVFHFSASQYFMFRETLAGTLAASRMSDTLAGLPQVVEALDQYYPKSFYENETKFALLRRLKPLVEGEAKKAFVSGDAIKVENLLSTTCDLRLGDLKDADLRNLFSTVTLALLYEYRLLQGMSPLRHATLVEESQNVVPYRDRTQEASLFEKMFFEMRKYGESLILVAQFPSQVFPDIVKSAGVKVIHRMTETSDSGVAMDMVGLNRRLYFQLKHLPVGRAVVLTDLDEEPLTVQFPIFSAPSRSAFADLTISASYTAS